MTKDQKKEGKAYINATECPTTNGHNCPNSNDRQKCREKGEVSHQEKPGEIPDYQGQKEKFSNFPETGREKTNIRKDQEAQGAGSSAATVAATL